jgi:hypothetical protein
MIPRHAVMGNLGRLCKGTVGVGPFYEIGLMRSSWMLRLGEMGMF